MKTLLQMLQELARPEVAEFAVASDRLPCIKVGGKYEPIDPEPRTTDQILAMLVSAGGSRYVEEMATRPAAWTMRLEGVGSVGVQAVERDGRVQARFVIVRRVPGTEAPPVPAHPIEAIEAPRRPTRKSIPAMRAGRVSKPPPPKADSRPPLGRKGSRPSKPPTARVRRLEDNMSEPLLRAAVVKPSATATARAGLPDLREGVPRDSRGVAPFDELLAMARESGASDVHLVAGRPLLLRLAGELVPQGEVISEGSLEAMLTPEMSEPLRAMLAERGSCDFALSRPGQGRFRVNVSRQRTGLKACMRLIPQEVPTLASLGLPGEIERATRHHQGLVVVTGPTGHGKTSTLAAIVDILNAGTTHHIITVEDPVEIVHPRKRAMVSQREVGSHTRTFAAALKASLREDPDVIVVGELRDTETVRMALAASETGHLVLGTMNTPSAAKTIDGLIDLFPPADQSQVRMTLAGGLRLIVSQRLVPTADGKGMVAAAELLPGSIALWTLIRDNKTFQIPSLQQRGKGAGILRLDESLHELVVRGRVTREAALAVAENPDDLDAILSGKRPAPGAPPVPQAKPQPAGGLLGKKGT
jgi:twitching motility protein PilT